MTLQEAKNIINKSMKQLTTAEKQKLRAAIQLLASSWAKVE